MFPTLIRIGDFNLATYGVLVAAGYLLGIWWLSTQHERMGLSEKHFWGLIYALFFGAILGGKLLYFAVEWRALASGALHPIRDIRYGFVHFGGALGMVLAGWLYRKRVPFDFLRAADYCAVAGPVGHAIGRIGCLMGGCCSGRPTDLPWGIRFTDPESLVAPHLLGVPLHPTQLYEAVGNILIAFVLYRLLMRPDYGKRPGLARGTVFAGYWILYSVSRFIIEFFRGDDRGGFLLGMSVSQWIALCCFAVAGAWLLRKRRRAT